MRTYSYYPGCTLKTKAANLDACARESAQVLGFCLEEIEDWQCCGAVYPLGTDEIAPKLSAVRALIAASKKNQPLVTLCSACHHVLKRANYDMKNNADMSSKVNNYLEEESLYNGEAEAVNSEAVNSIAVNSKAVNSEALHFEVLHFMEVLHKHIGFDKLKEKVVNPLKGRKIGAYYGCMLLRPSSIMQFDDPENPTIFEEFLRALGAEPVIFPMRNECCGGYISLKEKERSAAMASRIAEDAMRYGAIELISSCPLCLYNVNDMPVIYFTEILAEALGVEI